MKKPKARNPHIGGDALDLLERIARALGGRLSVGFGGIDTRAA